MTTISDGYSLITSNSSIFTNQQVWISQYPSPWYSIEDLAKMKSFMQVLEIPIESDNSVNLKKLYDILNDPEQCELLIHKLKNKAFF